MLVPSAMPGFGTLLSAASAAIVLGALSAVNSFPWTCLQAALVKQPTDWLWRHYQAYARLCGRRQFVQLGDISREKVA